MAANRLYEEFEPFYEWVRGERRFTIMLPGYIRNQLKIQVTSKPALKLMGERLIFGNRWRRFNLEFPLPSDYDTDNVTATFEGGKLSVTFAKLIKPKETTNPPEEAPTPKEPTQKVDEQIATKEDTPKAKEKDEKAEAEPRTNEVSDQKTIQKDKEQVDETEKSKTETAAKETTQKVDEQMDSKENTPKAKEEKAETEPRTNESDQKTLQKDKETVDETEKSKTETAASIDKGEGEVKSNSSTEITEAPKTKDTKSVARSKTRLVDFTPSKVENEGHGDGDLAAWPNKWKKLVKLVLLSLLVLGLGFYSRNAFRSSNGEWNFLRVVTSLLKYFH